MKDELDDLKETTGKNERTANEKNQQMVETEKKEDEVKKKLDELLGQQGMSATRLSARNERFSLNITEVFIVTLK